MEIFLSTLSASYRRLVTVVSCFPLFFWSCWTAYAAPGGQFVPAQDIQLVWSADYGQGEQIFFSSFEYNSWTIPVQISDGTDFVFKPVSAIGNDGKIWVVWTENGKKGSFLQFSVYNNSRWAQPQQIETGMDNNRAVTVIVDESGTPWIAWTGTGDSYSDVFWSRWNGNGWEAPVKAHAENDVPDINPALAIDDSGHIVLSRQTYANGKYSIVSEIWDGRTWQMLQPEAEKKSEKKRIQLQKEIPPLPDYIKEPHKATLFMKTKDGAGSVPLSRL